MSGYVTSRRVHDLRISLTQRDRQIISTLARVRVATTSQLVALHMDDIGRRRAQRRLTSLVDRRVLGRLPRRVGGIQSGSSGHVYALDAAGQRLADLEGGSRPRRPWGVGAGFLAHFLAVTELYAQLVLAERAGGLRVVRFAGEPASWRSFHGLGGARITLKPDAYVVLEMDGFEDHWFAEVDLGTEGMPAIARRCSVYRGYWQSGTEQARHDVFPRVLWLVQDARRAGLLAAVIARQPANARSLFAVSLHAHAVKRMRQGAGS